MAFYKKVKQKGDDKWHPRAVTKGHPYTTDEIARLLSEMSTVTPGDTYAVLMNLGEVLGKLMSSGHSVKLKGIGTFYYTCRSEGTGVDTPEEVSPAQITAVQIRFIPRILPQAMRTSDGTHPPLPAHRMGGCRRRGLMSPPFPIFQGKRFSI